LSHCGEIDSCRANVITECIAELLGGEVLETWDLECGSQFEDLNMCGKREARCDIGRCCIVCCGVEVVHQLLDEILRIFINTYEIALDFKLSSCVLGLKEKDKGQDEPNLFSQSWFRGRKIVNRRQLDELASVDCHMR